MAGGSSLQVSSALFVLLAFLCIAESVCWHRPLTHSQDLAALRKAVRARSTALLLQIQETSASSSQTVSEQQPARSAEQWQVSQGTATSALTKSVLERLWSAGWPRASSAPAAQGRLCCCSSCIPGPAGRR